MEAYKKLKSYILATVIRQHKLSIWSKGHYRVRALEEKFVKEGGFREKLFKKG